MKHFIHHSRRLLLLVAASVAMLSATPSSASAPVSRMASVDRLVRSFPLSSCAEDVWHPDMAAPRYAESITCNPEVTLATGEDLRYVGAFGQVDGQTVFYGGAPRRGTLSFQMPPGTYLTFAYVQGAGHMSTILLVKENVTFDADHPLTFNTAEAKDSIELVLLTPSGKRMLLPATDSVETNCGIGRFETKVMYMGKVAFSFTTSSMNDTHRYFLTNLRNNPFSMTELTFMGTDEGMFNMIYNIDTRARVAGTTASGWQTASMTFASTPMHRKYREVMESEGTFTDYQCAYAVTASNGVPLSLIGLGMFGSRFDTGKVGFWVPEGYDGPFSWVAFPMGPSIQALPSSIMGMPLRRGATEPEQLGSNFGFNLMSVGTETDRAFRNYCPAFGGKPAAGTLGNCAPLLMTAPLSGQVQFNYMGRYGEAINIDSWDLASNIKPDGEARFGNTNSVKVWIGDSLVSDVRSNFPSKIDWKAAGKFRIAFSTDNILIDGKLPGLTSGTLEYDPATYGGVIPSATALQLLNGVSGEVTDRFASLDDKPRLSLYAASISQKTATSYTYLGYAAPATVKVEYAPRGSSDFVQAAAERQEGEFYEPGFGAHYVADLSGIATPSRDGWFDLRITVTSAEGSVQTQTISPAFFVADVNGVESTESDEADAPAEYYSMQGLRLGAPARGVPTIVRRGSKVTKIVVR